MGKVFRVSSAFDSTVSTGSSSSTFTSDCLVIIVLILKIVFPSLLTSCTIFISVGDCCSRLFLFVWRLLFHVSSSSCGDCFSRLVLFVWRSFSTFRPLCVNKLHLPWRLFSTFRPLRVNILQLPALRLLLTFRPLRVNSLHLPWRSFFTSRPLRFNNHYLHLPWRLFFTFRPLRVNKGHLPWRLFRLLS